MGEREELAKRLEHTLKVMQGARRTKVNMNVWQDDTKSVEDAIAFLRSSAPAQCAPDPIQSPQYIIEGIILRRLHEKRVEGYTLEMSKEIAASLRAPEVADAGAVAWNQLRELWVEISGHGPRCRDCADSDGTCCNDKDRRPCDPHARALHDIAKLKAASPAADAGMRERMAYAADHVEAAFRTLQTIAYFPVTDLKNQDAMNMQILAHAVLPDAYSHPSTDGCAATDGRCDCGFDATACATNPCLRKKTHLAGLTPGSKWPNTGAETSTDGQTGGQRS